ncbi:MAG: PKD domain-containing protein, partial [Planctomycetota bacterium]
GPHTIIEQLDPRTSWSEGFAHFWSALVRRFAGYPFPTLQVDNFSTGHSTFDIEGPSVSSQAIMATNELAVACVLWDIVDAANEGPFDTLSGQEPEIWRALTSLRAPPQPNITLEDFHAGLAIEAPGIMTAVTGTAALPGIFKDRQVRYYADGSEANDSSGAAATLTPGPAGLATRTFHAASDKDWYVIVATPGTLIVETRNLGDGGNTLLELYDSTGTTLLASNDNRSPSDLSSQVSRVVPTGGTFRARVVRVGGVVERGYYDLRAQVLGNGPPTIDSIAASAVQGAAPLRVTFTAAVTDVDGGSLEFQWDFNGDGVVDWASFEGPTVTTTYQEAGTFSAQFRVIDSGDSIVTAPITITVLPFVPATVSVGPVTSGAAPHTVNFTATVSGVTPVALLWDIDDNGVADSASAASADLSFTYRSPGTFFTKLLVRDDQGRATRARSPAITVTAGASPPTIGLFTASNGVVPYASSMDVAHSDLGPSGVVEIDVEGDGRFEFQVPAGSPTGTTFLPEIQRAGTFSPVVRVTDTAGLSVSATASFTARTVGLAGWMVDPRAGDRLAGSVTLTAQAVPRGVSKSVQFQVRDSAGPGPWTNVGSPIVSTGTLFSAAWDVTALPNLSSFHVRILIDGTASSGDAANTVVIDSGAPTISESAAIRTKTIRTDRTTISRTAAGVWAIVPPGSTPNALPLSVEPASVPATNGSAAGKVLHGGGIAVTFAGTFTNTWILRLPGVGTALEIHRFDGPSGTWKQFAPSRVGDDGWVESDVNATGIYALFGPVPPPRKSSGGCGATGLEILALLILLRRLRRS